MTIKQLATKTIGVVMNFNKDGDSAYVGQILKGVLEGLEETGRDLKGISREQFQRMGSRFTEYGLDGVIITHGHRDVPDDLRARIKKDTKKIWPLVVINDYDPSWPMSQLYTNSFKSSATLAQYLVKSGCGDFYLMSTEPCSKDAEERSDAFLAVLKKNNIRFSDSHVLDGHFSEVGGYEATKTFLEKRIKTGAVLFCLNDAMAIGAIRAIGEKGLRCPHDIKVAGFDGLPQGEFANPPLTTMKFPLAGMGHEAVMIIDGISRGKIKKYIRKEFAADLVVRKSS